MKSFINYLQSMEVGSMPGSLCGCSLLFSREKWKAVKQACCQGICLVLRWLIEEFNLSSERRAITCILHGGNKRQELSCLLVRKTESGLLAL